MGDVGLFSRAKRFQQSAAANGGLDNDVEYAFKDSNSRACAKFQLWSRR